MGKDPVVGIVLVVLGALLLLGWINIPFFDALLGIGCIVAGIMILMGKLKGETWLGVTLVVAGAIVLGTPYLAFLTSALQTVVTVLLGLGLVVLGVMRLR